MNKNDFYTILFSVAGLIGVGYAIGTHTKMTKISEKLDKSIDDLAENADIDISEELVNAAVEKAVQAEAKRAVEFATREAVNAVKKDIHSTIQHEVDKEYDRIKETVLKEITTSAAKIDAARVRKDVEESAKKAALDKFDDNLDDILEKFNKDLDNTSKIYGSIRDALTKSSNPNKGFVVRLD